jgi:hypothetical protein
LEAVAINWMRAALPHLPMFLPVVLLISGEFFFCGRFVAVGALAVFFVAMGSPSRLLR